MSTELPKEVQEIIDAIKADGADVQVVSFTGDNVPSLKELAAKLRSKKLPEELRTALESETPISLDIKLNYGLFDVLDYFCSEKPSTDIDREKHTPKDVWEYMKRDGYTETNLDDMAATMVLLKSLNTRDGCAVFDALRSLSTAFTSAGEASRALQTLLALVKRNRDALFDLLVKGGYYARA